ncbi:MAG: flippase-like domain-containing protein [Bacteroidia bacterium]|nr:flippase-like domain-containing protein [Bacteroidia bacterium]
MNTYPTNTFRKGTSLFIKVLILLCSLIFIGYKLYYSSDKNLVISMLELSDKLLIALAFCLMFLNWGIEAFKWKFLVAELEQISFKKAFQSVFSGVTVSIFMPNRMGEFAGRIFFLEDADKIKATLKNFVGSITQLLVTLLVGFGAFYFVKKNQLFNSFSNLHLTNKIIITILLSVVFIVVVYFLAKYLLVKWISSNAEYINFIFKVKVREWIFSFLLSLLRYVVFVFQYYILLCAFGLKADVGIIVSLISITYLVTSFIPSFALTEIITRGATAVYFFDSINADSTIVLAASLFLWIINLAIPALIGGLFVWKMNFFNNHKHE